VLSALIPSTHAREYGRWVSPGLRVLRNRHC
jgi:hypothetical protein